MSNRHVPIFVLSHPGGLRRYRHSMTFRQRALASDEQAQQHHTRNPSLAPKQCSVGSLSVAAQHGHCRTAQRLHEPRSPCPRECLEFIMLLHANSLGTMLAAHLSAKKVIVTRLVVHDLARSAQFYASSRFRANREYRISKMLLAPAHARSSSTGDPFLLVPHLVS